jgi:phosphoribosylformimino-5-aminoimidazole carboxamide ribotide isomerase
LCRQFGPDRIAFSLDLKDGLPMGDLSAWNGRGPWDIVLEAIGAGVQKLIVLDLAQVGMGGGVSTRPLCRHVKREFPSITVITGGGLRHRADLVDLEHAGIDGVLIASALHDGSIGREDLLQ